MIYCLNYNQKDTFCTNILVQIEKGNLIEGQVYKGQNKLLKRYVTDGDKRYENYCVA